MQQHAASTRCRRMPPFHRVRCLLLLAFIQLVVLLTGCGAPFLSPDGFLVFPEHGDNGAMVLTPNGMQFRDRNDIPKRIVYDNPFEPWRNPVGFIAPADGVFTHTSRPVIIITHGLVVTVRPSDELVPTWGGELLLRVDLEAPAAAGSIRSPIELRLVLDGAGTDSAALVAAALDHLGPQDRVMVFDRRGVVVPLLPGNHRSLVQAAVERRLSAAPPKTLTNDLLRTLHNAWRVDPSNGSRAVRVVVLTDGTCARTTCLPAQTTLPPTVPALVLGTSSEVSAQELTWLSSRIGAWEIPGPDLSERLRAVSSFVPAPGPIAFHEVGLTFAGVPGPSHLIETSGGEIRWDMFADQLVLGEIRAGESRTEVVRLSVPSWTRTLPFELQFSLQARAAQSEGQRSADAVIQFPYEEDIASIARLRCGDVLAYGSALAWMNRLKSAFAGPGIDRAGGLYRVARMHQASMLALARDQQDRAALDQAVALAALLDAHRPATQSDR